jgi:hypothetical protein
VTSRQRLATPPSLTKSCCQPPRQPHVFTSRRCGQNLFLRAAVVSSHPTASPACRTLLHRSSLQSLPLPSDPPRPCVSCQPRLSRLPRHQGNLRRFHERHSSYRLVAAYLGDYLVATGTRFSQTRTPAHVHKHAPVHEPTCARDGPPGLTPLAARRRTPSRTGTQTERGFVWRG